MIALNFAESTKDTIDYPCLNGTPSTLVKSSTGEWKHPTGVSPKSLNLIALGPTSGDFQAAMCNYDPIIPPADETWTVNKGFRTIRAELVFILDDLIGERVKSERYYEDICSIGIPIITSIIDGEVRGQYHKVNLHRFPIERIIDWYGYMWLCKRTGHNKHSSADVREAGKEIAGYMKNSIPMMLAYAGFVGVRDINLFGADYDFPGQALHEADKPNCEYWVGMLRGLLGARVRVSSRTTLLQTNQGTAKYGYGARQPDL